MNEDSAQIGLKVRITLRKYEGGHTEGDGKEPVEVIDLGDPPATPELVEFIQQSGGS